MADNVRPNSSKPTDSEPLSKMTSGAEEMRDHDFSLPANDSRLAENVTVDTGKPPPEAVQSGGAPGSRPGDTQRLGDAPTVMNQDAVQPDFQAEVE